MILRLVIFPALFLIGQVTLADPPPNDDCSNAFEITGEGIFHFDNMGATEDGPPDCDPEIFEFTDSFINHDVWYCWLAPGDIDRPQGYQVTVETCGGTTVDTKIATNYAGEKCACESITDVACGDNTCAMQSRMVFEAHSGTHYMIRIGTSSKPGVGGGSGTFSITLEQNNPNPPTPLPDGFCQQGNPSDAITSNGNEFIAADNFTLSESGYINEISWQGGYFDGQQDCLNKNDDFEVRYYLDSGYGVPGPLIAGPYSNLNLSLSKFTKNTTGGIIDERFREYKYTADHSMVPVLAGECYWIEIRNQANSDCMWYWETASHGDGWSVQDGRMTFGLDGYDQTDKIHEDLAFCLNLPISPSQGCALPPENDSCSQSIPIYEGETFFDTTGASNFSLDIDQTNCDFPLGDEFVHNDIWFDYEANCTGQVTVGFCDSLYDSKVAVYRGSECSFSNHAIACNDDACSTDPGFDFFPAESLDVPGGDVAGIINPSDCFETHNSAGCDDSDCMERVCSVASYCCDSLWFPECARLAGEICLNTRTPGLQSEVSFSSVQGEHYKIRVGGYRNETGTGIINLTLGASESTQMNLLDFAALTSCFTGSCETGFCHEPMYTEPCCVTQDFDHDGDVDHDDYIHLNHFLTGP